jgi:SAM-dependent methyltransferase
LPSWLAKAAVQGLLSVVPGGRAGNRLLQDRRRTPDRQFYDAKLDLCRAHLGHHFETGGYPLATPFEALELGTGRLPFVPIGLALCGARHIVSVDIVPMAQPGLTARACEFLLAEADSGRLQERLPWVRPDRLATLRQLYAGFDQRPLSDSLSLLGIELRIEDIRRLPHTAPPFDLIVSNNTLEHIPPDLLDEIMAAFRRLAAPGVTMSHFIDLADHYSHYDRRLTPYNFLRYRPSVWRLLNNPLQYQNRLRVCDYRQAHARAGFHIVCEENDGSSINALDGLQLAAEFRHYQRIDLAVTSSWMVSRLEQPSPSPVS